MAREFDDLGFWLPSEFLTEDELLTDFRADRLRAARFDDFSGGYVNSRGFSSDLSSPGELVASPTETESEDDDLVAELTRKLAQSSLRDYYSPDYASRGWKPSGSPQSTLCGCKPSPTVSPNSVSGFCSPPDAEDYLRRDFLYAAAKEAARMRVIEETAARMRMIEDTAAFYSSKLFPPQAKPCTAAAPPLSPSSASGFYPNHARSNNHLTSQLLQAARMKKQQELMKSGDYGPRVAEFQLQNGRKNGGDGRAHGASMADWPSLQQTGSGKRAVFLGQPGPKKERTGTGVFLPQRYDSLPSETRKKPAAEKVVQSLNINVDSIDAHFQRSTRDYGASTFDYDAAAAALKHRNNLVMAQQRRNLALNQQLRLPNDWSY